MTNHVRIRYIFTAILLPFIWENVEAKEPQKVTQSETKFHVTLDYHYNFGLATKEKWWNNGERLGGHSLHLTALYNITPRIATGIGIGADRYTHPDFNTIPIYGTFRYSPITKIPKGYLYTNLGYGCFANEAISSGWMWDLGIGYTKMFRKHFGLNFQIGYTIPQKALQKIKMQNFRVYLAANNLFTITKYSGYDPEVGGGVDYGNYPQSRTFMLGVSLTF